MIWLASFPRSGNTFLRNVLYEVYGLSSSTFHREKEKPLDPGYETYPFVKTHELPHLLVPSDPGIRGAYLVRDGRDALCSMAHHRSDVIAPGTDFLSNLKAAIMAEKGTFFGGWSRNVEEWAERADLIIRFEDLVREPLACVERLRDICPELPEGNPEKLPGFPDLKYGTPQYGSGKEILDDEEKKKELAGHWFRQGKTGGWKEEMPGELHELFWSLHGDTMVKFGYSYEGDVEASIDPLFDHEILRKLGRKSEGPPPRKYSVLVEGKKIASPDNDGVKRYTVELLKEMIPVCRNPSAKFRIDVHIEGKVLPLEDCREYLLGDFSNHSASSGSGEVKKGPPGKRHAEKNLFQRTSDGILSLVPSSFKSFLEERNIRIFHKTYDFLINIAAKVYTFLVRLIVPVLKITRYQLTRLRLAVFKIRLKVSGYHRKESALKKDEKVRSRLGNEYLQFVMNDYDLIHLPIQHHFGSYSKARTRVVVTMHDYTHKYLPDYHTRENIRNAENGIRFINAVGADVINVSGSTFEDSARELGLPERKNHLTLEAADKKKFRHRINRGEIRSVLRKYGVPDDRRYLLCLSTIEPRKNLFNTIEAFMNLLHDHPKLSMNLVVAGKKGWKVSDFLSSLEVDKRIYFTGFVDDEDLSYLYSGAHAFVYVSHYEGFGLPLLEAMNCRVPVIYGNNSSMPEVVGEGGLAADPNDVNNIKEQMEKICLDAGFREEMALKAIRQANRFSWRKTASETLKIYQEIIERKD